MAEAQQELFKPAQLLSLLSRRRWLIIAPFCLAMLAGIVLAVKLPKMYEASTLILIEPQRVPANYVQPVVSGDLEERISTLSQQIMSRTNLEKIISDFNLYSGPEAANMFAEDKINDLRKRISVEVTHGRRETDAFTLSFRGEKPEIVAQVVNALASYFIDENLRNRESQAIGTSDFLEAEVETMRKRLETKEIALKDFRKAHMGELPEQLDSNLRILERLQEQLTSREQSLRDAKNRLVGINQLIEEQPSAVAALTPAAPGQQRQTLEDINDPAILKQQLAILKGRYTDQHPDIIRLKKRIADLEADQKHADKSPAGEEPTPAGISPAVIRQQSDIRVEIRSIEAEIADLHGQIENYRKRVESTPKVEQELLSLQRGYQDIQTRVPWIENTRQDLDWEPKVNIRDAKMRRPCGTSAMPACAMAYGARPESTLPLKRISPSRGGVRPATERMKVVLPMPLRPRMATMLPARISSDSPCST